MTAAVGTAEKNNMPEALRDAAIAVLDERKAENISVIDLKGQHPLTDYMIIASGGSARQLNALAKYLSKAFSKLGQSRIRIDGLPQGDWVLVDAGDVLIHLFRPEVRNYYDLEKVLEDD